MTKLLRSWRAVFSRPAQLSRRFASVLRLAGITGMLGAFPAAADHTSLWEVGLGAGAARIPYYRGSSQDHRYLLPVPAIVYRGERMRLGENGLEGILLRSRRVKLDISLAAGLPARSDEKSPRAGMPRLHATFELGPSLELNPWRSREGSQALWAILPLRAALSFNDLEVRTIGAVFAPRLEWVSSVGDWRTTVLFGPLFGNKHYHGYFYDVEPHYVTQTRPEYDAPAGYGGIRVGLSLRKRTGKQEFRFYLRYDDLANARFAGSPLVQQTAYIAAGMAMTWQVWKSAESAGHRSGLNDPPPR